MSGTHVETEDTFDVDDDFRVPALDAFAPGGGRVEVVTRRLVSTYFDTPDLRLLRLRVTLRRRDGDDDQGWHLKVPAGTSRTEIHRPLVAGDDAVVPSRLASLVHGLAGGAPLAPVAVIVTTRTRHRVLDAAGALLVEVDDDLVEATPTGAEVRRWREVEVELGGGATSALRRVGAALQQAGARPAPGSSKLGRTLTVAPAGAADATPLRPGAAAVHAYLVEQVDELVAGDVGLRRGADVVHATRVAARRLRSTLRVFGALLDPTAAAWLDRELRWWAGELGVARDAQVQRERHRGSIEALAPELVLGPVLSRLEQETTGAEVRALAAVGVTADGPRYGELLAALRRWREDPPFTRRDARREQVRTAAERAARQAERKLRRALRGDDDELLHDARKAAKRARYAHELLGAGGAARDRRPAKAAVRRYKQVQQVLGDHQDAVVAAQLLRRLGAAAGARGENGFTFGLLWQREQQRAADARREVLTLEPR